MRSISPKIVACTAVVAGSFAVLTTSAGAAEPTPPSCLGESFSAAATAVGSGFGQGIVFFARVGGPLNTQPGLGDGIQNIQGGQIPDEVFPNTCN